MQAAKVYSGTGRVRLNGKGVYALWVWEPVRDRKGELPYPCERWRVRVGLDEWERMDLPLFSSPAVLAGPGRTRGAVQSGEGLSAVRVADL